MKEVKPKYMNLTEQDRQLLLQLHDFIYLHIEFIEKHILNKFTPGSHHHYRRLKDLERNGYIRGFLLPVHQDAKRPQRVFTLAKLGVDTVEQLRGLVHWNPQWSATVPVWYQHQLLIAETVQAYITHAESVGLEVKQWIPEARTFFEYPAINSTVKTKNVIRPDGVLVLGKPDSDKGFAHFIEMERSYASKEKTINKMDQYNDFFSRQDELMDNYLRKVAFESDIENFRIIFVGGEEAKTNKLIRDLRDETSEVPVLIASKKDVEENPFGRIYRSMTDPETWVTL